MKHPFRIALLLYPGCMPAGLFAFADLLHAANRQSGRTLFSTCFASLGSEPVSGPHGARIQPDERLGTVRSDAVLVPGLWAESTNDVEQAVTHLADLRRELARRSASIQMWSYCTGVALVAATGCLDGRDATATWWLADALRLRHRRVRWRFEHDCVVGERVMTASGASGHLPIAQTLIERELGTGAFLELTRLLVLPRPAPGHSAFDATRLIEQPSSCLRALHRLVERLPAERLTSHHLATQLGMSARTLARKVAAETGSTLAAHVRRIKLNQVAQRLVLTSEPAAAISAALGFSSESNMQRAFKAVTGMTPGAYRRRHGRT